MSNILLGVDDTCSGTTGWGMKTSWTLNGSDVLFTGSQEDTDGYTIRASLSYVGTATYTTSISGETLTDAETAYGTCVVSVDTDGATQPTSVIDQGNQVMCHWIYILGGSV
jgi:hypothetical protein